MQLRRLSPKDAEMLKSSKYLWACSCQESSWFYEICTNHLQVRKSLSIKWLDAGREIYAYLVLIPCITMDHCQKQDTWLHSQYNLSYVLLAKDLLYPLCRQYPLLPPVHTQPLISTYSFWSFSTSHFFPPISFQPPTFNISVIPVPQTPLSNINPVFIFQHWYNHKGCRDCDTRSTLDPVMC